jgi:hypothetical protein
VTVSPINADVRHGATRYRYVPRQRTPAATVVDLPPPPAGTARVLN